MLIIIIIIILYFLFIITNFKTGRFVTFHSHIQVPFLNTSLDTTVHHPFGIKYLFKPLYGSEYSNVRIRWKIYEMDPGQFCGICATLFTYFILLVSAGKS